MSKDELARFKHECKNKLSRLVGLIQLLAGVFIARVYQTVSGGGEQAWPGWLFLLAAIFCSWILIDMGGIVKHAVDLFVDIRLHQIDQKYSVQNMRPNSKALTPKPAPTKENSQDDQDSGDQVSGTSKNEIKTNTSNNGIDKKFMSDKTAQTSPAIRIDKKAKYKRRPKTTRTARHVDMGAQNAQTREKFATRNQQVKKYSAEYWRRHLLRHLRYDSTTSLDEALLRYSNEVEKILHYHPAHAIDGYLFDFMRKC